MATAIDVRLTSVSKRYYRRRAESVLSTVSRLWHGSAAADGFWAVRDVTFDVASGEVLGIVGANGAGKSTLLKLLSGITAPTTGEILVRGRLSSLIELGSGFHPELTGRENVFLSGAILGMSRREIAAKFDRIVEFSGVADFIDSPVKWYSSGMYVRLGFAVAAHGDPDVLLVDEVLAVGDEAFQEKCYQRVGELRAEGTTVIFISHDLTAVERLCDRALLMRSGQVVADERPAQVTAAYRRAAASVPPVTTIRGKPAVRIAGISFHSPSGCRLATCRTGDSLISRVAIVADQPVQDVVVDLYYATHGGTLLHCQQTTGLSGPMTLDTGLTYVEFMSDEIGFQPGAYTVSATILRGYADELHTWTAPTRLVVDPGKRVRGYFYMPHRTRVRHVEAAASVVH